MKCKVVLLCIHKFSLCVIELPLVYLCWAVVLLLVRVRLKYICFKELITSFYRRHPVRLRGIRHPCGVNFWGVHVINFIYKQCLMGDKNVCKSSFYIVF